MFGIKRFTNHVISHPIELKNLDGSLVEFKEGERVNLLSLSTEDSQFFGIQNKAKGLAVLLPSLFHNNFTIFQKGV